MSLPRAPALALALALACGWGAGAAAAQEPWTAPYDTLSSGELTLLHTPGDSLLAAAVADAVAGMADLPGIPPEVDRSLEVVLARDRDDFAAATGGAPPHWSAGVAIPARGRIVLPAWRGSSLLRGGGGSLLRHEWAHVATWRAGEGRRAPRWFSEGYAEWVSGWDRASAWRLRVLMATGRTPPLDSLSLVWPAGRAPAESAYLLSASVVEYLVDRSGVLGLETLFRQWRESGAFEEALRTTYGVTSGQLEEDWAAWARDRYGWLFVLTHSSLAWGILALLLVATAYWRRRHNKERMARLRARELPEEPAFWDPDAAADGIQGSGPGGEPSGDDDQRRREGE